MTGKLILFLVLFFTISFGKSKEEIQSEIVNILSKLSPSTKIGMMIYNPLTQDTIFSLNHTAVMIPASNNKLFTTATALSLMGGNYPLSTKILADNKNAEDGVLQGNIYIKGYGNSTFTEGDLDSIVLELKHRGIKKITGNIIGDDTYFDNIYSRDDWIGDEISSVKLPPVSAIVVDRNVHAVYKKRGRRMRRYISYIQDPPLYAAELLKEKLQNSGIEVNLNAIKGTAPLNAYTLTESAITLKELIKLINKSSDNFLAECLFKTLGAISSGLQGNSFYSTQAVLNFIEENGIYADNSSVVDGSGISRFNQITVGAVTGLLEKMYFDLVNYEDFYDSFSIAGVDGTLAHRMIGTTAENNFHGKTGTLEGIISLAGYLTTKKGDDLIISIFFEFSKKGRNYYRDIQDEIVQLLAEWE
jgi:D-alanyl-D-alanine carboxypeptidase